MKILLYGYDLPSALERVYKKHFIEAGADVYHYPGADIALKHYSKSIVHKILSRTGIYTGFGKINKEFEQVAHEYKPDVIFIFKGMELYPATVKRLAASFKMTNYNPDHPFIIGSRGGGNSNVTNSVGHYHLHFCYHGPLMKQIQEEYNIPCVFLPFGYELTDAVYNEAAAQPELNKVCFLGNPDTARAETVLYLAQQGLPVDVYGHGWHKTAVAGNPSIGIHDAVYGDGFWKKLRQYRLQINIFRKHNIGSHNMRTFEVPAVGGIQLTPHSEEQVAFFKANEECFYYHSNEELAALAKRLLALSPKEALVIRNAARQRSLASGYSYKHRAHTVLETCRQLAGQSKKK
jgi:spore maturation protein CgeB